MDFQRQAGVYSSLSHPDMPVRVCDYGVMAYSAALAVLTEMVADRSENRISDTLMLLEHPPTYTMGLRARKEHLLVPESELKRRNIDVFHVDRGGDITFHGPGQLVGYPVLDLKIRQLDIRAYVSKLEKVIIQAMTAFGVAGYHIKDFPGVWVDNQKIAAIGIKINAAGISCHGFAVNVNTDLTYFKNIVPCGLREVTVTSLAQVTGHPMEMDIVKQSVTEAFMREFQP